MEQLEPIAARPVADLKPIDLLAALKRIEAKGKYETARRCRSFAGRVFRYAVATGRGESDPSSILRGALVVPKVKHHAAILDPKQMGELLRAIDAYTGHAITRLAMQVSPHVMARPGELRMAEWSEFDRENTVWKIPSERMKMRRPHEVPLSRQVLAYLEELFALTGPDGFVFPAFHTSRRPMSENTVNQAFWRMGYPQDELIALRQAQIETERAAPIAAGLDPASLDFRYAIEGDRPDWRPLRAFDDGTRVFVEFPESVAHGELPPLFVLGTDGQAELVNYRVSGRYMIVDRLFASAELRLGGGRRQNKVRIVANRRGRS